MLVLQLGRRLGRSYDADMDSDDVMLLPRELLEQALARYERHNPAPDAVTANDGAMIDQLDNAVDALAAPVSASAGLTTQGVQVGLQMVAPHLHDRRSIRFATLMERELGGFVPSPGFA